MRTRGLLKVLAPPAQPDDTWVIDEPESDGTTCVTWNGQSFGVDAEVGEQGEIDVRPGHDLDRLVEVATQRFTVFSLVGADRAVARIVQQPFLDGGGTPVPHERATGLEVFILAQGHLYRVSLELQPGRAGVTRARQVLASLRLE